MSSSAPWKIGGAWCKGCIRGRRPRGGRSIRSAPIALHVSPNNIGGDLIPQETDPRDPAPRALAPEEPESRNPPRAVVTSREGGDRLGGRAKRLHANPSRVGFQSG